MFQTIPTDPKKKMTKYLVTSSLIDEIRKNDPSGYPAPAVYHLDPVKKVQETNLVGTKPCQYVRRLPDGEFEVCSRKVCTYAHSLAELRIINCMYGSVCTRRLTNCQFIHPEETNDQYYSRTGKTKPDLPAERVQPVAKPEVETYPRDLGVIVHPNEHKCQPLEHVPLIFTTKEKVQEIVGMAIEDGMFDFRIVIQ